MRLGIRSPVGTAPVLVNTLHPWRQTPRIESPLQPSCSCPRRPHVRYRFRMASKLSHYDDAGRARMVDVSGKAPTRREAEASAFVHMSPAVLKALPNNPKGDPLEIARIAGIMAAKRTSDLIP